MVKRKSPYKHKVSAHIRSGTPVRSFTRGSGAPIPTRLHGRPARRRVVGAKRISFDPLTGLPTIEPMKPFWTYPVGEEPPGVGIGKPRDPYTGKPYRGIGRPRKPRYPPLEPPTGLPMPPGSPPPPTSPIPVPMPILVPDPIPVPPGAIRRRHGGWVSYDTRTGGVTTYIPGTRGQPGVVTYTPKRITLPADYKPGDPLPTYEPPIFDVLRLPPILPGRYKTYKRRIFKPGGIMKQSNQLLAKYKRTRSIPEKIDIYNQLKALSDEHMRLTGNPTSVHNMQPTDLFTKKQLEQYGRRLRG